MGALWSICLSQFSQRSLEIEDSSFHGSSYAFGFGTGVLAAAAVSCCSTLEQFLPVALETVLVSFRVGLLAADTREQIVIDENSQASWRVRIETGKPKEVLSQLEELCNQKVGALRTSAVVS